MAFLDGSILRAIFGGGQRLGLGALAQPSAQSPYSSWLPITQTQPSSPYSSWLPNFGAVRTQPPVVQHQGSGGLLGAIQAKRDGAPGTPIRDWLGENSSALMNFGAGLAGGKGWDQGISMALAGASQGREDDQKRRRRMAATQAIAELQRAGMLKPEIAALVTAADDPIAMAAQYLTAGSSEPKRYEVGNSLVDAEGNVVFQAPTTVKPPEIREVNGRLVAVSADGQQVTDITPEGAAGGRMMTDDEKAASPFAADPRPIWIAPGGKPEPINGPSGMSFESDGQGGFKLVQGQGVGAGGLTTGTTTSQQGKVFDAQDALTRLETVKESFRPEFVTLSGKLENAVTDWKSYLGIGNIGPDEQRQFIDYTMWRARTAANVNQVVHDMSGTAITEAEAIRLMKALPTENDSPLVFQAKLEAVMVDINAAIAKYQARLSSNPPAGETGGVGASDLIWDGEKLVPAR